MKSILIAGYPEHAGKSAVAAALGVNFRKRGSSVGYYRPAIGEAAIDDRRNEAEAALFRAVFDTEIRIDQGDGGSSPASLDEGRKSVLDASVAEVGAKKDILLVEAPGSMGDGVGVEAEAYADHLDARVLLVVRFFRDLTSNIVLTHADRFGSRLAGVIFNMVPPSYLGYARESLVPEIEAKGIKVWGTLRLESVLQSLTIGQLADAVGGRFLNADEKRDELIENLLVGARSWDPATPYLARGTGVAFITRGDLQDVQLAAMDNETTRCLILTGGTPPAAVIRYRAAENDIPIVTVENDTLSAIKQLEGAFAGLGFSQRGKVKHMLEALSSRSDVDGLVGALVGEPVAAGAAG